MEQGSDSPVRDIGVTARSASIGFWVAGKPAPQGSMRSVGKGHMISDNPNTMPWREAIVSQAMRSGCAGKMLDGPLFIDIVFMFEHLKKHRNRMGALREDAPVFISKPPDLDKLCRAVFDALTQARVVVDDALFVQVAAIKKYTTGAPGALIMIGEFNA